MTTTKPPAVKAAAQLDLSAYAAAKAEMHQALIAWQKSPTDQPSAHGFAVIGPVNGEAFFLHESGQEFCLRTGESTFEEAINLVTGQIMYLSHNYAPIPESVQQSAADLQIDSTTPKQECATPPVQPVASGLTPLSKDRVAELVGAISVLAGLPGSAANLKAFKEAFIAEFELPASIKSIQAHITQERHATWIEGYLDGL
jgi:hypothetical protein